MTLGIALIGCGVVGKKRAASLPEGSRLLALADKQEERAHFLAQEFGLEAVVTDSVREAVQVDGVELVMVATVHSSLADCTLLALRAGRHVLVEKPGAHNVADLRRVRELAEESGRLVRVGFNHRFHPAVLKAKELVEEKVYGELIYIRGRYGHGGRLGYEKEWRADQRLSGGGELLDQGMHLIDLARYFAGDLKLVFAETRTDFWKMEVEDNAYLALRPSRGFVWLHVSWTEWKNLFSLEITFEKAKLDLFGLGGSYGTERLTRYQMQPEMGPPETRSWKWPGPDLSWRLEIEDVLNELRGGAPRGASIHDCIAAFEIVEEAYSG